MRGVGVNELLSKGIAPCAESYLGVDLLRHMCGRPREHPGSHHPWAFPSDLPATVFLCDRCYGDVTAAAADGAIGFIQVQGRYFHTSCAPRMGT